MGHHYVPQRYLRNFETGLRSGLIWQFSKSDGDTRRLPIKVVAQSRDYYEPEMEKYLANEVEPPGGDAIDKLLRAERLDNEERLHLARYLGVTMQRVPRHRDRVKQVVPKALAETMSRFRELVHDASRDETADPARVEHLLDEADRIERKYEAEPPQTVKDKIRDPLPSPVILGAIISMNWNLCESLGPQWFVASDNPFFFTSGKGLGKPDSEFFLPLSPTHLLHGNRGQPTRAIRRCTMPQNVVREVNKLTAVEATSFVFANAEYDWIPKLLSIREHWTYRPNWKPKYR